MDKGIKNDASDALSHHPVHDLETTEVIAALNIQGNPDISMSEMRAINNQHNESLHLQELCKHARQDKQYQLLQKFILNGFPKHLKQLPETFTVEDTGIFTNT